MEVVLKKQVIRSLDAYKKALENYPITNERRHDKVDNMRIALENIKNNPTKYPICMYKKMGQKFDEEGKPLNLNLRLLKYTESKSSWYFAYLVDEKNDRVIVTKMNFSRFVTEDKFLQKTLDLMERLSRFQ